MTYTKDAYKGKYTPENPSKYRGDIMNICFRSSYELRFMRWCDLTPSVLEWGSEEIIIPYRSPHDKRMHRYFVDFYTKVRTKDGTIKTYFIEVKPFRFTQEPKVPKRKTKHFIQEVLQWGTNTAKWDAAKKFASQVGAEFMLITERDLGTMK